MSNVPELDRERLEKLDKASLIDLLLAMQQQLAEQRALLQKLGDQLAKDSHNSSKPPSSDGLKKPAPRSLRQSGQRPLGGQPGHMGGTLRMVSEPARVETHPVTSCPHCQSDLSLVSAQRQEKRQVFEIPAIRLEVTEHRAEIKQCPCCGETVTGDFPSEVTQPTQYGLRLKTQASYLNQYHFIPLARTEELLSDFYGQAPSQAVILEANQQLDNSVQPTVAAIQQQLISEDVVHFDESGLRVAGALHWLHVASTSTLTHYHVDAKRGDVGMSAGGILPHFQGTALHDHWASYLRFEQCDHAFCNSHHLRELLFIAEQYQQPWATELACLLLDGKAEVAATPTPATALPADRLLDYTQRFDQLIAQGLADNPTPAQPALKARGRPKQSQAKNLLDRLAKHKAGVLAFLSDFRIPFDNNQAERDVRMIKVKQKVSGSFRTTDGADSFCTIRSYISTARKQGLNVLDTLLLAFRRQPFIPATTVA